MSGSLVLLFLKQFQFIVWSYLKVILFLQLIVLFNYQTILLRHLIKLFIPKKKNIFRYHIYHIFIYLIN